MNFTFRKKHTMTGTMRAPGLTSQIFKDPFVDWFMVIIVGALFGLIGIAIAGSLFLTTRDVVAPALSTPNVSPDQVLNQSKLSKLVVSFENHQTSQDIIRKTPYTATKDPSQ